GGFVNVHTLRLVSVATRLLGPDQDLPAAPITIALEASALREAVNAQRTVFGDADQATLRQTLLDLFRELRRQDLDPASLLEGPLPPVTRAALAAYQDFRARLVSHPDPTSLTDAAARSLLTASATPSALEHLGALVLYLPTRF